MNWLTERAPNSPSMIREPRTSKPVLPWEWRKRKSREWGGLLLGVGALGFSLRRSQRDPDCWGEIIYVPVKQTSGRIDSDCIEWQWQSERGDVRGQRSIDPSARGAGDSTLIEARISGSWLEGQGTIFKKDFRKTQSVPESGLYLLHSARLGD